MSKTEEKAVEPVAVNGTESTEATTPGGTTKDRRRLSFFSGLGTKKVKKTEGATSDAETSDVEGKRSGQMSPRAKLEGLFRKPSKAPRATAATDKPADAAKPDTLPETTTEGESSKDKTTTDAAVPTTATTAAPASTETAPDSDVKNGAIGDVVPDAVTVGQAQPTAAKPIDATA